MGDCHILCAATHVPIEPGSRAVGILVSQTNPKYETVGGFPHKPCHYWQFVAGSFLVEETCDYTPLTDFQDKIRSYRAKIAHLDGLTETPLNKVIGNKLVIPQLGNRPPEHRPLSMVWFREEAWEFLKTLKEEEGYWETRRRELLEFALGKRKEIPTHLTEKESFMEKLKRREGKSHQEICRGEIADEFLHSETVDAQLVIRLDFGETDITGFLEGLLEFLPIESACRSAGVILQPNTYAQQEHWYNFEATRRLQQFARDIDARQQQESEE